MPLPISSFRLQDPQKYRDCCVVFRIEMQVIPQLAAVDFVRSALIVFWIQVICMGIFLPIQYRFGYEKTKLFAMLLVVAGPVLMSVANSVVVPVTVTQSFSAVPGVMYIVLWVIGGALWLFSMFVSKKIFSIFVLGRPRERRRYLSLYRTPLCANANTPSFVLPRNGWLL